MRMRTCACHEPLECWVVGRLITIGRAMPSRLCCPAPAPVPLAPRAPGSPRGVSTKAIPKGIKERLLKAGFTEVRWVDTCQGFSATRL